ncbi:glycoside hydrolase family 3 protein [Leifsonia sp. AG29]|uniref:glycoside hydrolase family 3 protein n=1 Tax=Leifsonia sp. AG29 TaxID=2598860 RepID=UPI00131EB7D8|nr:glycoside hydrolase family 3 C-terminal domain-containing protein [Leifsonia sp. AG29]
MTLSNRRRLGGAFALSTVVALALAGLSTVPAQAAAADRGGSIPADCPWMNTHQPPTQRANELLAASTLDQKIRWLDEQAANNPTQTVFPGGFFGGGATYPAQVPCTPKVVYTDGPDYVRGSAGVTVFPSQIALGASFDSTLAYDKGKAEADEAFRSGKNVVLGPGVSSSRTPLAGRTPEYLGEDSLLSGTLAGATINGIQTGNPTEPVGAEIKHFIANEQELDRTTSSSNLDERTLREVYNQPFAIAIDKGNPSSAMCSFNQVNGVYACENPILNNVLKDSDQLSGYVVSDFGAVHSTVESLKAGLDQELNAPNYYAPAKIHAAIDNGSITVDLVNQAAFRVVKSYIEHGLFDHPLPTTPSTSASNDENKAVSERIAEEGSVLLKNDGSVLPLGKSTTSIAVIGPTVSNTPTNGVSAKTVCNEGRGGACPNPVAPLDAITSRAAQAGATVTFNNGADLTAAAAAAASAKVAVVFGYAMQGEFSDRTTLALDNNGDALISAVAAANPNTVVVLETGSATTMPWLNQVKSVIEAWYPGDQQGTALAKLIYGDVNFTGKLPMTFPKSLADTPTSTPAQYPGTFADGSTTRAAGDKSIRQVSYSEGLAVGYKWYQAKGIQPLFPFGYGLSYTSFAYSDLAVTPSVDVHSAKKLTVSFTITNTGTTAGQATPQVYLTLPGSTGEPGKRLVAFDKVSLNPGQTTRVTETIRRTDVSQPLSYWSVDSHSWATDAGVYGVHVGNDSTTASLSGSFTVTPGD